MSEELKGSVPTKPYSDGATKQEVDAFDVGDPGGSAEDGFLTPREREEADKIAREMGLMPEDDGFEVDEGL